MGFESARAPLTVPDVSDGIVRFWDARDSVLLLHVRAGMKFQKIIVTKTADAASDN
jgi:hypothetical protein